MTVKDIFIAFLFSVPLLTLGQSGTVLNARTGHPSAVLDLSLNTDKKAFLPPRVALTSLTDKVQPIQNPAEGLIVYNVGLEQLPGFYVFSGDMWNLMATRENSVINAFYENKSTTLFNISHNYATVGGFSELDNNSGGDIVLSGTNSFELQPGVYVVDVAFNISSSETATGAAISNSNGGVSTHAHYYSGRLWDGTSVLGSEIEFNAISNTSGTKKHAASFNFTFKLTTPTTVSFQLKRREGGSYSGNISFVNSALFIEKSLL